MTVRTSILEHFGRADGEWQLLSSQGGPGHSVRVWHEGRWAEYDRDDHGRKLIWEPGPAPEDEPLDVRTATGDGGLTFRVSDRVDAEYPRPRVAVPLNASC